jgi:hypothetical protein
MPGGNWAGEDPNQNCKGRSDRAERQQQAKCPAQAARAAGHGKRRI